MDITTLVSENRNVDIVHPATHEPVGLTITIRPPDSDEAKTAWRSVRREFPGRNLDELSIDDEIEMCRSIGRNVIVDWAWHGDGSFGGEQPDCTKNAVYKVCGVREIGMQIVEALSEREAFFKA